MSRLLDNVREKMLSAEKTVVLAPGAACFVRMVSLPDGTTAADIPSLADLALEAQSPFPLDQLYWGYFHHGETPFVLAYALFRERLPALGIEEVERIEHLYPSFILALGETFERETIRFVLHLSDLSAVYFSPGEPLPRRVASQRVELGADPAAVLEGARALLGERLNAPGAVPEERIRVSRDAWVDSSFGVHFAFVRRTPAQIAVERARLEAAFVGSESGDDADMALEPGVLPEELPESEADLEVLDGSRLGVDLWRADVRDNGLLARQRRNRRAAAFLWRGFAASAAVLILLLVGQFALWGYERILSGRERLIAERAPEVSRLMNMRQRTEDIRKFSSRPLRPFEMLAELNPARPASIYFTRAVAESSTRISIQGEARSQEEVNRYAEALLRVPGVDAVDRTQTSRRGTVQFTLEVTFEPGHFGGDPVVAGSAPE